MYLRFLKGSKPLFPFKLSGDRVEIIHYLLSGNDKVGDMICVAVCVFLCGQFLSLLSFSPSHFVLFNHAYLCNFFIFTKCSFLFLSLSYFFLFLLSFLSSASHVLLNQASLSPCSAVRSRLGWPSPPISFGCR